MEASPPVNLVVELPDPPLPGSTLLVDVGIPPPLASAFDVDFGTQTDPWLSVHSSTETILLETCDAEIQTTAAPSVDFGSQMSPTQLPMANSMTQTDSITLVRFINQEFESLQKQQDTLTKGSAASCDLEWYLDYLSSLRWWAVKQDQKGKKKGMGPLRIFGHHSDFVSALQEG